jgi:hypothetical protein
MLADRIAMRLERIGVVRERVADGASDQQKERSEVL